MDAFPGGECYQSSVAFAMKYSNRLKLASPSLAINEIRTQRAIHLILFAIKFILYICMSYFECVLRM